MIIRHERAPSALNDAQGTPNLRIRRGQKRQQGWERPLRATSRRPDFVPLEAMSVSDSTPSAFPAAIAAIGASIECVVDLTNLGVPQSGVSASSSCWAGLQSACNTS